MSAQAVFRAALLLGAAKMHAAQPRNTIAVVAMPENLSGWGCYHGEDPDPWRLRDCSGPAGIGTWSVTPDRQADFLRYNRAWSWVIYSVRP